MPDIEDNRIAIPASSCAHQTIYTDAEVELLKAVERFKREKGVRFPTIQQIFKICLELGYRKVASESEVKNAKTLFDSQDNQEETSE